MTGVGRRDPWKALNFIDHNRVIRWTGGNAVKLVLALPGGRQAG